MRLFLEITRQSIRKQFTYRAAMFAGLFTNFFFGVLRASILVALYGTRTEVDGLTIQGGITYVVLGQAVIGVLSLFSWYDLMQSIYTGEISVDLLKPISLFRYWLAQDLGRAGVQFLMRGLVIILLYEIIFDLYYPSTLPQWLSLVLSLGLSWWISFAWRFLVNLAAFWTPDARGIIRLSFSMAWFASGFIMPLRLYPDWVQTLCNLTPFPHTVNTFIEVYLGVLQGPALLRILGTQLLWAIGLTIACAAGMRKGIARLVIQGG